jgi:hypothetical protein
LESRDINLEQPPVSTIHALDEIQSLPLSLDSALFLHYPAMKLGQLSQVEFFCQQLYETTIRILQSDPEQRWVITAPAYYHLPAGANLLARGVHALLKKQGIYIPLIEPRLKQQPIEFNSQEAFKNYHDYSKNNLTQRIAERQRVHRLLQIDNLKSDFEGRAVIIINDINVTGTQQHFMQQVFDQLNVAICHWSYIFNINNVLANRHPDIEHQINNSQISDLDGFAEVLVDKNTRHTARCISRLFNQPIDDFRYLLTCLGSNNRAYFYRLAQLEGRFNGPLFDEKVGLLGKICPTKSSAH